MANRGKLSSHSAEWHVERLRSKLIKILSRIDIVPPARVAITHSSFDSLRLLTLEVWAQRYQVDLEFVVRSLFDHFGRVRKSPDDEGIHRIGISIVTLCGKQSEKALQRAIKENFPDKENISTKRYDMRRKMREHPVTAHIKSDVPELYAQQYKKITTTRRNEVRQSGFEWKRTWRGNPWL